MIGYVFIGIGAALWLSALVAVLRDRTSGRVRRIATLAVLLITVPIAVLYWLSHH